MLAGRVADSQDVAAMLRQRSADYPSPQLGPVSVGVSGRAALAAGRLDEALDLLNPTVELLVASDENVGWTYRYQLPHTIALGMRGNPDQARAALDVLDRHRHPGWQYLEYERALAQGWVAAAQGAVSEAISTLTAAAETARANGQFAAEVVCLQTVTQFGDGSRDGRLRELENIVEGPAQELRPASRQLCSTVMQQSCLRLQRNSRRSRSDRSDGRGGVRGPGASPCGTKGIIVDVLGACGRACTPLRRCKHSGASQGVRAIATERP